MQASLQQVPSAAKRALQLKPHAEEADAEEQAQAAMSVVLKEALPVSWVFRACCCGFVWTTLRSQDRGILYKLLSKFGCQLSLGYFMLVSGAALPPN